MLGEEGEVPGAAAEQVGGLGQRPLRRRQRLRAAVADADDVRDTPGDAGAAHRRASQAGTVARPSTRPSKSNRIASTASAPCTWALLLAAVAPATRSKKRSSPCACA